ncbi:metal-dependent hydrolase [Escherichia albertii]|uniref:metal-dependent hydrolase n=1 Tax=Escherichia albertii TaxID=208962 RepID=UPI002D79318A|nr:metal-dependent hydrolase [Escherichia albertii]WRT56531.1 metal-dependent hydrolase [Escherichia albertii]
MTAEGHLLFSIACAVFAKNAELTPVLATFYLKVPESWFIPADALQGMVLGYLSHILADMLTPAGVPLLWPCRWRFRLPILVPQKGNQLERFLCMALFVWSVWMPHSLPKNGAIRWSSQMINTLQIQFHRLIKHQVEY